jgi:hypothetical protein
MYILVLTDKIITNIHTIKQPTQTANKPTAATTSSHMISLFVKGERSPYPIEVMVDSTK